MRRAARPVAIGCLVLALAGCGLPPAGSSTTTHAAPEQTVIGVIDNYHQKSLRYPLEPTLLLPVYSTYSGIAVKIIAGDVPTAVAGIKKPFDAFFPGNYL